LNFFPVRAVGPDHRAQPQGRDEDAVVGRGIRNLIAISLPSN